MKPSTERIRYGQANDQSRKKAAYDAWYLAEIDKGLANIEAGRIVSNDEAKAHMSALFAQLEAENNENRKAA